MSHEAARRVGPYEILSTLGQGGMGTVYLARDVRLGRRVALKVIDADRFASSEEAEDRVLREARAASALNHLNICQVFDVGGEGRQAWIAMELVEGAPLASSIRTRGRFPSGEAAALGRQVAEALAHAHHRGILHRDLKSANIVCDREGRPKILDFGIARRLVEDVAKEATTRSTRSFGSSAVEGTLPYMAPEAIRGEPQDERSDLWSLGVVLYEMLTGTLPFQGRNAFDLAANIVQGPAVRIPDDVPPALAGVVSRLLSRDPAARFATAAEVASELSSVAVERRAQHSRARLLPYLAGVFGLAAIVIAGGVWLWRGDGLLELTEHRVVRAAAAVSRAPAYSPDRSMLALLAPDAAGVEQIWVQNLKDGSSMQVTNGSANAGRPRWLPATNRIVFALAGQGIWTVSPIGGTPTRLIERGTNPNVSYDGSRIVFEDRRSIWTASADGSVVQQVMGMRPPTYNVATMPALSPDGSTIAYFVAELGPNGDLWKIPAAGGTPTRLTSDLREAGWPVWTPDGRAIVFSSARAGSRTLWQIPAVGGQPMPLTVGAGEDDQPDITRDGREVAYTNVRNSWDLKVRHLESGEERTLLQRSVEVLFPKFSPDGTRITYFGRSDHAVAIFTIGVNGTDARQLTGGRELNHHPRWGADGQDIYFFQAHPTRTFRRVPALGGASVEFRRWEWATSDAPMFDHTGRYLAYLR
jgi:eukaryotic-like serine/threonine-protein kinase